MNLSTLLRRASLVCAAITVALTSGAAEVTLNGFTTVGESKAIQVTYALNKTEKVARVRRVNDTSTSDKKRKSCVIPQTITVDKVKYTVKYIGEGAFSHTTDSFEPPVNDKNACKFQRVELPNTITEICQRAFVGMNTLKYCNIPTSVKLIYPYAFMWTSLESAAIPASCTGIGASAFQEAQLKTLTFAEGTSPLEIGAFAFLRNPISTLVTPKRLSKLWNNCFDDCEQMTDLILNGTLTVIPEWCFGGCPNLISTLVTPKRLSKLWNNCFDDCEQMTDLILNGTLTVIPEWCFGGCPNLARVTINAPIATIDNYSFQNSLTNVQSFKITNNALRTIGHGVFIRTGFTTISPDNILHEGLTYIGEICFEYCPKLTTVIFPSTIKKIDKSAFGGDETISPDNILHEGLTYIGEICFEYCPKLTTVIFPSTIKKIDKSAFGGDETINVRRIDCYTSHVPELDNTFNHEIYDKAVVNVKPELAPQFSKASFWEYFNWDKYDLAIDDIAIDNYDSNRPVEYYTLQGMRVDADNLTPGIYIRRHNGRSEKIAIR